MIEMLVGVVFAAIVLALPYLHDKIGKSHGLKFPKLSFLRRKEVEEKLKEVDEKLEEVVSTGVSKKEDVGENRVEEKIVPLDDAVKTVQVDDNLLEEMETANTLTPAAPETESEETKFPDVPELPELNSDLDVDVDDLENEIKLVPDDSGEEEDEEEDVEEVDFDEEDDLISSIAKEVEVKEEEEIDLLRDLKGQKFSAEELEKELQETLQRLKALAEVR